MRSLFSIVVTLVWGLWLGGIVMTAMAAMALFKKFDPVTAGASASTIFVFFEQVQFFLAGVAVLAALGWALLGRAGKLKTALLLCFIIAGGLGAASSLVITPQVESLRRAGQTQTPQFKKLHGQSSSIYTGEAALLLVGGILLPIIIRRDARE